MQPSQNRLSMARAAPSSRPIDQMETPQRISRSLSGVRRLRSDGMFYLADDCEASIDLAILPHQASLHQRRNYPCYGYNILIRSLLRILDRSILSAFLVFSLLCRRRGAESKRPSTTIRPARPQTAPLKSKPASSPWPPHTQFEYCG